MSVILHAWSIDPATAQPPAPQAYRITAGDKIGVTVFGQPDLSGEPTVDQSGNIRLPMIGDIHAVNLTLTELEESIAQALTPGIYSQSNGQHKNSGIQSDLCAGHGPHAGPLSLP